MKSINNIAALELDDISNGLSHTYNHCRNVAQYSKSLAKEVGFTEEELNKIEFFSFLHDIGKIAITPSILYKPSRLTEEEFKIIKKHPEIGIDMLFKTEFDYKSGLEIILYHHEYYDGSG